MKNAKVLLGTLLIGVFVWGAGSRLCEAGESGLPSLPPMQTFREMIKNADAPAAVLPTKAAREVPVTFSLRKRLTALHRTFYIKTGKDTLGIIQERTSGPVKRFCYIDTLKKHMAEAQGGFFLKGGKALVRDARGSIGVINETMLKEGSDVYTRYTILDAHGREIAVSGKVEWLGHEIVLTGPSGRILAEVRCADLSLFSERWDVIIHDMNAVDPRLILLITVYHSSVNNDLRQEEHWGAGVF